MRPRSGMAYRVGNKRHLFSAHTGKSFCGIKWYKVEFTAHSPVPPSKLIHQMCRKCLRKARVS